MLIRYSDFQAHLAKRRFYPNYFVFGPDTFLIERAIKGLLGALEETSQGRITPITLDLDESSVDDLLNIAQSLPMFAPKQLLVVRSALKLREQQAKRLTPYFSDPNPQTVGVFLAGDLDKDQRKKKIFEILSSGTRVVELAPLEANEVEEWMRQETNARGCSIEKDAVRFLLELQGSDLGRLQQEVE